MTRLSILLVSLLVAGIGLAGVLLYAVYEDDPRVEQTMCQYLGL